MENFTPVTGLVGGALIGLSAGTLLLFNGDILGASGLMSSFIATPRKTLTDPSQQWKLFFVVAFFVTSRIYLLIDPTALDDTRTELDQAMPIVSPLGFLIGGFLVGFGTRLGNGCTTGHGICGMARLSIRSFVGVMSFMTTGVLFASLCPATNPHIRDTRDAIGKYVPTLATNVIVVSIIAIVATSALVGFWRYKFTAPTGDASEASVEELANDRRKILPSVFAAVLFAVGLLVSQMALYSKIFGFLDLTLIPDAWDPTLIMVMGGGLIVSFLAYQWVKGFNIIQNPKALECPLAQKGTDGTFNVPRNKTLDLKLILGEAIFGLGWGMAGLCPGPAMVLASIGYQNVLLRWWPMFFAGSFLAEKVKLLLSRQSLIRNNVTPAEESKVDSSQNTTPHHEEDAGDEEAATEMREQK